MFEHNLPALILLVAVGVAAAQNDRAHFLDYEDARRAVIQAEDQLAIGGRLQLSESETQANDIFMRHKLDELARGYRHPETNAAAMHFFKSRQLIERGRVWRFLRRMPKGALLHVHNTASVSSDWVARNISYMPGMLRCTNAAGVSILSFRRLPEKHGCRTRYVLVQDERQRSVSPQAYDRSFEQLINLYTPVPEVEYPSIKHVWDRFQDMFSTISDAICYLPVYRAYHQRLLEEMHEDGIMYAEVRMSINELYDVSGRTFDTDRTVRELLSIVERFRAQHPEFMGIKVIYTTHRNVDRQYIRDQFEAFKRLHNLYPEFIVGFDLVGQEDLGRPLYAFIETLAVGSLPRSARFFFHAGETNWYGAATDLNLLDAILLNTTRIGHGFALAKHPLLWGAVQQRDIAVEVSPISNQVLHLVADLRNHPGTFFMSQNIPMVICNDDPGFWNARGLSYDFYYAIMALAPNHSGLRVLKQLVWNSLRYSTLQSLERQRAFTELERQWALFIDDVVQGKVL